MTNFRRAYINRRGYATQVGRMTNPLLSSCDEDDSDEDDE